MKKLSNLKFKNKIIMTIFIIGAISTIAGNIISYYYQVEIAKKNLINNTILQAKLISENCWLPMEFNYPNDAKETLDKLYTIPDINDAILYTLDDSVFASYHKSKEREFKFPDELRNDNAVIKDNFLHIMQPVTHKGHKYGYLYIRSVINWKELIGSQIQINIVIILIIFVLLLFLAYSTHKVVTKPIIKLAEEMKEIGYKKDFSKRLHINGDDEITQLYQEFNFMISEIETKEKDLKRAYSSLEINENRLKKILDKMPIPISIADSKGNITFVNEKHIKLFGYSKDELSTINHWIDIAYPDLQYREKVSKIWSVAVESAIKYNEDITPYEYKVCCKNGEYLTIIISGTVLGDDHLATFLDITELKKTQEKLQLAYHYTRSLIDASLDPLVTINADGIITDVNTATEKATGVSREILIGSDFSNYFTEPQKARFAYQQAFEKGFIIDFNLTIKKASGQLIDVLYNASVYKDANGQVLGVFAAARDITERKRAEKALYAEKEFNKTIIQKSPAFFVAISKEGKTLLMNNSMLDALGYIIDEVVDKDYISLFIPDIEKSTVAENFRTIIENQETTININRIQKKDGSCLTCEWRGVPIINNNSFEYFIGVGIDITERQKFELELKQSQANLLALIESTNDLIWSVDMDYKLVTFNSHFAQHFKNNYNTNCFVGASIQDVLPSERAVLWNPMYDKVLTNGSYKLDYNLAGGRVVELFFNSIFQDGNVIGISIFGKDITERKLNQDLLVAKTALLEAQLNSTRDGILVIDENQKRILVNKRINELFEPPAEIMNYEDDSLLLKYVVGLTKYPEQFLEKVLYLYAHPDETSLDEVVFKNGMVLLRYSAPVLSNEKKYLGRIWTFTDITEQKKAEEQIQLLKQSIDKHYDGAYWTDSNNTFIYINKSGCNALGYLQEELLGRTINFVNPLATYEKLEQVWKTLRQNGYYVSETKHRRKDGTEFPVELIANYIEFDGNEYNCSFARDITERKNAEELLLQSEEKFSKAFRASPDIIIITSIEDGRIIDINDRVEKILGYTRDELVGKTTLEMGIWEDLNQRDYYICLLNKNGFVYDLDVNFVSKNRGIINAVLSTEFLTLSEKNFAISSIRDITEKKLAQNALEKSEALLKEAQKIARVGNWELDLNTNKLNWSDEIYEIFELDKNSFEATYDSFLNAIHPEDRNAVSQAYSNSLKNHKPYEVFHRLLLNDGRMKYVQEKGRTYYDNEGNPLRSVGTVMDITEIKEAEEQILKTEKRFRSLVTATSQIVWETNPSGEVVKDLPSWREYTGQTIEELKGFGWADAVHPDDRRKAISDWNYAVQNLTTYQTEYRLRNRNGEYFYFVARGVPILENGMVVEWIGTCTDITQKKMAEEEILLLNSILEQKVLERTAQLEASNKELEAFSYSVSHDLRAPLRHINGFTELLVNKFNDQLPDKAKQYLKTITDSSHQMGKLIDDLLRFSRIGKAEIQTSLVNMNKLVNETIEFLNHETPNRKINWQVEELPDIYGDSSMLKQVWANLLSNAVKYTGTRDIAIIRLYAKKEENNITYYVEDNGVGFDMKYCDKLFGVFQRLHSSNEFEGTGIGLANVRRIISRHHGKISAIAEIEKGATFKFSLPIQKGTDL